MKQPVDIDFKEGDRICLKGRQHFGNGKIIDINLENNWVSIDWDNGKGNTPKICHLFELERYSAN